MNKNSLVYDCIIALPLELGEKILCKVYYHNENNGIGSYEFWGQCGFDAGNDYREIDDIEPYWKDETDEEKALINKHIADNWDAVCEEVTENL